VAIGMITDESIYSITSKITTTFVGCRGDAIDFEEATRRIGGKPLEHGAADDVLCSHLKRRLPWLRDYCDFW